MKLEKLGEALAVANEYEMDGIDVAILAAVAEKRRTEGEATIMQFSSGLPFASFGTIHARVRRMVDKGILTKQIREDNQRYKVLGDGPVMAKFLNKLSDI